MESTDLAFAYTESVCGLAYAEFTKEQCTCQNFCCP